jgi:hypothetical protein
MLNAYSDFRPRYLRRRRRLRSRFGRQSPSHGSECSRLRIIVAMTDSEAREESEPSEGTERRRSNRRSGEDRRKHDSGPPDGTERRKDQRRKGQRRKSDGAPD